MRPTFRPARRPRRRRGSLYVSVTFVALIVSLIGLSTLAVIRIERRGRLADADAASAQLYARSAVELGLTRVASDPDWRFVYKQGAWLTDVPIGSGTYTLEGFDTTDGVLGNDPEHPVRLVGTGKKGEAVQKFEITLVPAHRGYSALKSAIHAGHDLKVTGVTLDCDQTASANNRTDASSAQVRCDVQAVSSADGGTYRGEVEEGIAPRTMPDPNKLFDYYLARGTTIDVSQLPVGFGNVIGNPGLDTGTDPWVATPSLNCDLSHSTSDAFSGAGSLKVKNRLLGSAGPQQDVTGILENGTTYDLQARIKTNLSSAVRFRAVLRITTSSGSTTFTTSDVSIKKADGWVLFSRQLTPSWSGTLSSASLRFETNTLDFVDDFWVDAVVFKQAGSDRTIHGKLLSPTSNPFSPGTNPEGIYVINLAGQKLIIEGSRIAGTLVLVSPGAGTTVGGGGAVNWRPAVTGFPALLVRDGDCDFNPGGAGLSEFWNRANFNPAGTPYDALGEDAVQDDTYPSQIDGLVYGTRKLRFKTQQTVNGTILADDDVEITGPLVLRHDSGHYRNPPPGFSGPEEIRVLLDSARKPLN